jgi:hypothetical protein
MTDPMIAAARRAAEDAFDVLRTAVRGIPATALNAKPAGDDTNSIAVLATHAMSATRLLLRVAVGLPELPRDRDAEFAAVTSGPEPVLQMIDAMAADCFAILDGAGATDWNASRTRTRGDGSTSEMPAAYALIHAIEHLRGHVDEASLTRHVVSPD